MFTDRDIRLIPCGVYQENCYLIAPPHTDTCWIIDPGDDLEAIASALFESGRRLEAILLTHGHFDHILAAAPLSAKTGAPIYLHPLDIDMVQTPEKASYDESVCALPFPENLKARDPGTEIIVSGQTLRVIHTPGHSRGSVCFYSEESHIIFTGDTLFRAGYGRTDLYGGDIEALVKSLRVLLHDLPEDTLVYSGHGSSSTIGQEKRRYRI